jgi:hypothetical protein
MIETFIKRPESSVLQSKEEPAMLLIGEGGVAWIRLPDCLGGTRAKAVKIFKDPCIQCDRLNKNHYKLSSLSLYVCECRQCGFLWYRK